MVGPVSVSILKRALEVFSKGDIEIDANQCSRAKTKRSSCSLCIESCPSGAIEFKEKLLINDDCTECGICIAACPNGVFRSKSNGDRKIIGKIKDILRSNDEKVVYFNCTEAQARGPQLITLSCLGRLTELILLGAFAVGAKKVMLKRGDCKNCNLGIGSTPPHLEKTLSTTRYLCNLVGLSDESIEEIKGILQQDMLKVPLDTSDIVSKRGFFSVVKSKILHTTAEMLPDFLTEEKQERRYNYKRKLLLEILKCFEKFHSTPLRDKTTPFAQMKVNESCIACNVCQRLCPSAALKWVEKEEGKALVFKKMWCTNCGICRDLCYFKAIDMVEEIDLKDTLTGEIQELIYVRRKECKLCGDEFFSNSEDICLLCKKATRI